MSSTGWRSVGTWFAKRRVLYLGGIVFVSVFMGILMYFTWGASPNSSFVICVLAIPVSLLGVLGLVLLVFKAVTGPPRLVTTRTEGQVLTAVEQVLDGHGITHQRYTFGEYASEHDVQKANEMFRYFSRGQGGYIVVVPGGAILIRDADQRMTIMQPRPADLLPDTVKVDIQKALQ